MSSGRRLPAAMAALLLAAVPAQGDGGAGAPVIRLQHLEPDGRFRWLPEPRAPSQPRLGVALGGGAVWGISHLGLLDSMAADGLRPDLIAGTSVGAIIGGALAAGYSPAEVRDLIAMQEAGGGPLGGPFGGWRRTERARPADPLNARTAAGRRGRTGDGEPLPPRGAFSDQRIVAALANYLARADALAEGDLDRLAVPFRAVASDLVSGESYAPRHASLTTMVRASIGLPVFAPVALDGRLLVDGGATEVVPIPTARRMGAEVVVGVRVSRRGERLSPFGGRRGFRSVARRYDELALADQRERLLSEADLVVESMVGDVPLAGFSGRLDDLIDAGRRAWEARREELLRLLEARASEPSSHRLRAVEGSDRELADELARHLGLGDGARTISRLRMELALCRLVRDHDLADARLRLDAGGRAALEVVREPPVRRLELRAPASIRARFDGIEARGVTRRAVLRAVRERLRELHRDGSMFAGITAVDWDAASGALTVALEGGVVESVVVRDAGGEVAAPGWLAREEGEPADVGELVAAMERAEEAGHLEHPRIGGARRPGPERYELQLRVHPEPRWEVSWNLGVADMLGPTGWLRARLPRFAPASRWGMDFTFSAGREGRLGSLDLGPAPRPGWSPLLRLQAARPQLLLYDADGDGDGSRAFTFGLAGAGVRWEHPRAGRLELLAEGRHVSGGAFLDRTDAERHDGADAGLGLHWRGDRPGVPWRGRVGLSWSLDASLPLAGEDRAASFRGDAALRARLDRQGRWSLVAAARLSGAAGDDPLPLDRWAEAGAWWEAPPLSPGQGRARSLARGSLILSRRLGLALGMPVHLGATVAWWWLDDERADPFLEDDGFGGSVFLELVAFRFGSVFLGVADGDAEGDRLYFLFGPSRPRWP